MKAIYAKALSTADRQILESKLKSLNGIEVRRSQMILMSAEEQLTPNQIAQRVGCSGQYVRQVLVRFNEDGMASIDAQSRARLDDQRAYHDAARERLREMIQCSPREFGHDTSLWTLELLAEVSYERGLTDYRVHKDTVSETLRQLGMPWKRAKKYIHSPDPNYDTKKNGGIGSKFSLSSTPNGF